MGNIPPASARTPLGKPGSGQLRRSRSHQERQNSPGLPTSLDPAWQLSRSLSQPRVTWFLLGVFCLALLSLRLLPTDMSPPATAATPAPPLRPRFVLFGDSITQQSFRPGGWGAALADRYARKADVVLRGYSGYNSRWALHLLERVFPQEATAPALVTVFFGANDAALPDRGSERQHVPIPEYQGNLRAIVAHIRGLSPSTRIILISPPPVDEESRLIHQRDSYGDHATGIVERSNDMTGQYARACLAVGHELGVPVLDMWQLVQEVPDWARTCLSDGLHLTPQGNNVVYNGVIRIIESEKWSPSLVFENLPWDFPEHGDIDATNPKLSFVGEDSQLVNDM